MKCFIYTRVKIVTCHRNCCYLPFYIQFYFLFIVRRSWIWHRVLKLTKKYGKSMPNYADSCVGFGWIKKLHFCCRVSTYFVYVFHIQYMNFVIGVLSEITHL